MRRTLRGWCLLGILSIATMVLLAVARPAQPSSPRRIQMGLASFYGPGFHGEETASGEIFDQREMVAAHRSLPFGTIVRVTNLENKRAAVVRVIDRGPYGRNVRKGAIIDVSRGVAKELGFVRDGLVRVRVEVVKLPEESGS
ncbi:MAG: septal ring lytic transglycosylase RlpA family protein [Chloroflexota bacterium]|nr:septal ring lytic transglycosylase RlpA family protein [Chloroflexota bacterium]